MTLILTSLFCGIASSWPAEAVAFQTVLSELPITFPVQSPEVAAYFNQIVHPEDIASFPPRFIHLLPQVIAGQKMVGFASWDDAERDFEALIDQIDIIMYNPEHWENTPANEQQNLRATVQRAAEFVHARGLRFMFAPDRRFAEAHLGEVAPYVDAVLLQGQRIQHDPQAFASWVLKMANTARTANPEMQIFVQVGATRGTASEMFAAIQTVADVIDGIAIWSMPGTLDILQEFVKLLRESPPVLEATPSPTSTVTPATAVPTESDMVTSTPIPVTVVPTESDTSTPTSASPTAVPTESGIVAPTSAPATVVPTESDMLTSTPGAAMVPTSQSSVAMATPDKMAVETSSPTAVPASQTPLPQMEQDAQILEWLENVALIVGGTVIGLLLGFGLGRKQRHGSRG